MPFPCGGKYGFWEIESVLHKVDSGMTNVTQLHTATATFDDFWEACPYCRRIGKVKARAKWDAITGDGLKTRTLDRDSGQYMDIELKAAPETIIAGMKAYDRSLRKEGIGSWDYAVEPRFILHPATFLNQGRWEDYE